ncbi:pantoate--beta-alanine ligase [Catalinimonas alkaloidigena]|uniref:pantoate--beta-alanine ligase n=1 Tax=Catalinimonas alkaloidigena TaxID=1075417 RepID=UPI00240646C2|nr:pantoate--beta-alanine ligase [Catalinimonas alkaloidigena]MDF9800429.1 pantoate--beta-alanine ligase [Catalinimonas alkaloidigena]
MQIFKNIKSLQYFLAEERQKKRSVGLVPTMGALHEGHLKLLNQSQKENDITVCSIYVNPAQFNNTDDLKKYPRDLDHDQFLLEKQACDVLFSPSDKEMYPEGNLNGIKLGFGKLEQVLEGKFRPGHFSGVGIILSKLFHIVNSDKAYFGQKDLQQCSVVRKLIEELFFSTQLVIVPTVRENNGLAMSSRNTRLSEKGKDLAANLYHAITKVKNLIEEGEKIEVARQAGISTLKEQPKIRQEYFEVIDKRDFTTAADITPKSEIAVCVAAFVEEVRLIDNVLVFS